MNIQEVHEMVDNAVLNLVLKYPTYAQFLVRIGYKYKNFGNAIACTDGKTVYINDELIAEINNDREIVNFLDDYLVALSPYLLQVTIWANKANALEKQPEKFDKYFESFTTI